DAHTAGVEAPETQATAARDGAGIVQRSALRQVAADADAGDDGAAGIVQLAAAEDGGSAADDGAGDAQRAARRDEDPGAAGDGAGVAQRAAGAQVDAVAADGRAADGRRL